MNGLLMRLYAFGLVLLLGAAPAAFAVEIRQVRLWNGPDGTRMVLELSGQARSRLTVLQNPERVVLDIADGHLRHGAHAPPAGVGAIRRVRMAAHARRDLRVVLELSHAVQAKSFITAPNAQYGYRLVVDLGQVPATTGPGPTGAPVKAPHAPAGARDLVVAIDAGHGGEDPGAIGMHGTREKDVVLAIARDIAARLNNEPGMRAVLTRSGDYFVPLRDRMRRARAQSADLFVSVHADAALNRHVDGSSVYILSPKGATDEASRWLAERENASDLIGGVSLDDKDETLASVLLDLSQSAALSASEVAAERVLRQLNQVGELRRRQVQQARFMVLKSPDIPSMLVETAYISNPEEEQRLRGAVQQARLAEAIARGVHDYFYANPPPGSRIAELAGSGPARTARVTAPAPERDSL